MTAQNGRENAGYGLFDKSISKDDLIKALSRHYVSTKDVARIFNVTTRTVKAWHARDPRFPRPMRFSHTLIRWSLPEILAWQKQVTEE